MAEVVLALDVADGDAARRLLDRLPALRWAKVGPVLFVREGPALVAELRQRGLHVFLDLKWHDIPNTVAGAVRAAVAEGVALATVHCLGGAPMLAAAREAAAARVRLCGVTVLTSHAAPDYGEAVGRDVPGVDAEVERLARLGIGAGLDGVVCSPHEVGRLRATLGPAAMLVVPGIRRPGEAVGDQQRAGTPAAAVRAGATHLVVGRPIHEAADPAAVLDALLAEAGG
ncbi:MAG: orotidine-5'-phosphate decarboxylase [Gemmatimonadales bacterium]|nr:orotidine-5'-phosphate decarboxylase [Gemmatimonadales bacterium]